LRIIRSNTDAAPRLSQYGLRICLTDSRSETTVLRDNDGARQQHSKKQKTRRLPMIQRVRWYNFKENGRKVPSIGARENPGSFCNQEVVLKHLFLRFLADQSGATAIEYGLIAAGISLAIIAAVNGLGSTLSTSFTNINNSLK
jgi:pilus assembly protein Flp/PilA